MLKLMISYMGHGGSPIVEYNPQISRYDRAVQEVEKLLVPNLGAWTDMKHIVKIMKRAVIV